uniref:BZIP domain-containing protein n=1 Tax=Macrostomum lignano TaxID=282301 RepID=A0A1I8I3V8_9PLAT
MTQQQNDQDHQQEYRRLVMEELKCKILLSRINSGKDEIDPKELAAVRAQPPQLSEEARRKMEDRRERNKLSARRCRENKKSKETKMKTKLKDLELENSRLKKMVTNYQQLFGPAPQQQQQHHLYQLYQQQVLNLCHQCHRPKLHQHHEVPEYPLAARYQDFYASKF